MVSGRYRVSAAVVVVAALVVFSGVVPLVSGAGSAAQSAPVDEGIGSSNDRGSSDGAGVRLDAPRQPRLVTAEASPNGTLNLSAGESATVTVELTAERNLTDVRLGATSPLGLTVDARERDVGRLAANESVTHEVTVRADRAVERTVAVIVEAANGDGTTVQRVPLTVDALPEDSDGSSAVAGGESAPAVGESGNKSTDAESSVTAASASSVVVAGQAAYTYETYYSDENVYGLSGVRVLLYDIDGGERLLAEGTTAEDGSFRFSVDAGADADGDGEIQAEVVVYAESDAAYVSDGESTYTYYVRTDTLSGGDSVTVGTDADSDGTKELISKGNNAPYQAIDWANEAHDFASGQGVDKSKLPIYYPKTDWASYYYRTNGYEEIRLSNRSEYAWDRSTIAHEYGHAIHFQLIGYDIIEDDGYNACHTYFSETDPAFALVEGFAEYYSAAALDDPDAVSWGSQNIETNEFYDTDYDTRCIPGDDNGEYDGRSVEGSVASILWDITDGGASDDDTIDYSFAAVADVLERDPSGINEFYQIWNRGDTAALDRIYTTYGIDKLPPTVEPTLQSTPYTDSSVVLNGWVLDDEVSTESLEIAVDDGVYVPIASGDGNWSATRELSDGNHTVSLRATDVNGNTREITRTIRVSSTPPSVATSDQRLPAFGSPNGTVSVGFDYEMRYPDEATVRVLDNGSVVATVSASDLAAAPSGGEGTVDVQLPTNVTDGSYDVSVVVTDAANRTSTSRVDDAFLVDTTAPTIGNVTLAEDYVNASTPLSFTVGAVDGGTGNGSVVSGVERVAVASNTTAALSNTSGNWTGTVSPNASDGSHTAVVRVVDAAGNVNRTTVTYEVDSRAPRVNATAPRFTNASEATLSGNVTDANLTSLTVRAPNSSERLRTDSGNYSTTVTLENGSNDVVLVATDAAGNTLTQEVPIGVDREPPEASLTAPGRLGDSEGPPAANDSAPTLAFDVTDDLAGLDESDTTATIDGATASVTASRANGTVTVTGSDLADGNHSVTVRLVDRAGNVETVERTFVVDTVAPTIENATLPRAANRTIDPGENVTLWVNASDAGTAVGTVYGSLTGLANDSGTWRGNAPAPIRVGNRSIAVRVVDAAGNVERTTVAVYVGTRQTVTVDQSGVATAAPSVAEVESVSVALANGTNDTANATVELTSAVTAANPAGEPVADDYVPYYAQFAFDAPNETDGGSFVLDVSRDRLNESAALANTLTFWVHNETADEWTQLNATRVAAGEELRYRVETPHYSTFAVSAEQDDAAPRLNLTAPTGDGEIESGTHDLVATFADDESRVLPNETWVAVDGEARNLSAAATLNDSRLRIPLSLDAGNHTVSVRVVDRFGNERVVSRNVTVVEPATPASGSSGAGGGGGGGGGGQSSEPVRTDVTNFEDSTTVRISDIGHGAEFDVGLAEAAGEGLTVASLDFAFTFDAADFRVELGHPRASLDGVPAVGSGTPIGYVGLEAPGLETDSLDSASVTVAVSEDALPDGTTQDDVTAYQYVDGEWQSRDVQSAGDGTYEVQVDGFAPLAVVAEAPATEAATPTSTTTATPTATATPAPTATSTETATPATTGQRVPGFGPVVAAAALLVAALLARRHR